MPVTHMPLQSKYSTLLALIPGCLERYEGVDENGASMFRWAVVERPPTPENDGGDSEDEDEESDEEPEIDPEEAARRAEVMRKKEEKAYVKHNVA